MKSDSLAATEAYSAARATAPRVSLADMEGKIVAAHYFTAGQAVAALDPIGVGPNSPLDLLTICILVMRNGFTIIGKSAPASPENFDSEKGMRFAYEDAINQLWPLEGYALRERLSHYQQLLDAAVVTKTDGMEVYIGTKVVNARPISRLDYNRLRGWKLPDDENGSDEGYLLEYTDRADGNVAGFVGYVSWSPKAVFERAYRPV